MNFSLTNKGKEYLAEVNAGAGSIQLTKVVTGSGTSSNVEILTNVIDEKQQIQLDEVTSEGEYTFIHCVLSNLELETEYVLKQLGIFARNAAGEEILFIIGQDSFGDRIPALSEKEVEYLYNIGMRASNASEVTFDFSVNDFLRKKYFYDHLEEFAQYKKEIQEQFKALLRVKIGDASELDRKDTILFETIPGTNKVTRIQEKDSDDQKHEYEFAATFKQATKRENIESEETLGEIFGKIKKHFSDMKPNSFKEADNPFVLMTETTYKPPLKRTSGSLYGLITKTRGLIIVAFNRYIQELENPPVENTLYGVEKSVKSDLTKAENPYVGILYNLEIIEDGSSPKHEKGKLYGTVKRTRGE